MSRSLLNFEPGSLLLHHDVCDPTRQLACELGEGRPACALFVAATAAIGAWEENRMGPEPCFVTHC